MHIIEVIPLTTLPPQVPQLLSYYFNDPLPKGAIVEISLNNRKIPAVVASIAALEEEKILLKKSGFQLKKLTGIISEEPLVTDQQFKLALWLAKNYFAPLSLCLKTVLPPFFLKKNHELKISDKKRDDKPDTRSPLILISRAADIIKNIESEIKKTLDQKKQALVILPEISVAEYFFDYFIGNNKNTVLLHSRVPAKKTYEIWNDISSGKAEIIIGTRQALFVPFSDLGLILMEDPKNEAYKSDMSPKYNTPDLALKISEYNSCPITFISQIPDIKSYSLAKNGIYKLSDKTSLPSTRIGIIDMIQEIRNGNFSVFSRNFKDRIIETVKKEGKILIFSSRRGYSGSLLCQNCSFVLKCPDCSIPLRSYSRTEPMLICNRCSYSQKNPDCCPNCKSYKIKKAGYPGSQKIEEELDRISRNNNLKTPIFILDSSYIKTPKAEKAILKQISETKSCICIATQMIFSHRFSNKFSLIGVPNVDSLTVIPDYRAEESLFNHFEKLLDFEPAEITVQTYNPHSPTHGLVSAHNYKDFYEKELQMRRLFWYPPFARLVKLSYRHKNSGKASYESRILGEKLKMAVIQKKLNNMVKLVGPSPAFVEKEKGLYTHNIVLKLSPELKPEEILKFVPTGWIIDVDPKSIL